jgi:SAM-dependent methyltransferase
MNANKPLDTASSKAVDEVQAFYDRYPYPPPVADLEDYRRLWNEEQRLQVEFHLIFPQREYQDDLEILVAGCGTSQAARYAVRQPNARVTGIDISETSLHHTHTLKNKYKLKNLQVKQLPIERVYELGCQFDKIICTGVLHHLVDPEEGLRALREILKPQGGMYVMLYAAYGRTGVTMLQEYCRRLGIEASDQEIEDLIAVLKELPRGHPLDYLLRESPDFRHPNALADALLNPRARAYNVPQVFEIITRCGLKFGRWYRQAPYSPQCGVLAGTPHGSRLAKMSALEQYAVVELFRGTITHHSFITFRDDYPGLPQPIRFDGDAWLQYVPLRHPSVICVQQRLPPGAAGVLINQDHVDTDLIHPIDFLEKRIFDAIDGQHNVAEIITKVSKTIGSHFPQVRAQDFLEQLWLYDQVVFDASHSVS